MTVSSFFIRRIAKSCNTPSEQVIIYLWKMMNLLVWAFKLQSQHATKNVGNGSVPKISKSPTHLSPNNSEITKEGSYYTFGIKYEKLFLNFLERKLYEYESFSLLSGNKTKWSYYTFPPDYQSTYMWLIPLLFLWLEIF